MRKSTAGVLVKYEGITVEDDTKLRAAFRAAGVDYCVMKNSLTGRACDEVGYGDMKQYLVGMTALALSETDPVAPAKIIKEYAEKIESFEIKAGFVEGELLDAAGVNALAEIPSKEQLIVKMLGSMMSPLYGLAYVLQAKIDKDGGAPAEEAPAEA
jgi:large subunit ribosomal protein L10